MKKIFISLFVVPAIALAGCASQIMKGLVGKNIREAQLSYGPPINAFDMGDCRRAFQWKIDNSYTTPVYTTTTGNVASGGHPNWYTLNSITTGGQTFSTSSIYTLFAKPDPKNKSWIITGFKKPSSECE